MRLHRPRSRQASTRHIIASLHAVAGLSIDLSPRSSVGEGDIEHPYIRQQTAAAPEPPLPPSKIGFVSEEAVSTTYRSRREGILGSLAGKAFREGVQLIIVKSPEQLQTSCFKHLVRLESFSLLARTGADGIRRRVSAICMLRPPPSATLFTIITTQSTTHVLMEQRLHTQTSSPPPPCQNILMLFLVSKRTAYLTTADATSAETRPKSPIVQKRLNWQINASSQQLVPSSAPLLLNVNGSHCPFVDKPADSCAHLQPQSRAEQLPHPGPPLPPSPRTVVVTSRTDPISKFPLSDDHIHSRAHRQPVSISIGSCVDFPPLSSPSSTSSSTPPKQQRFRKTPAFINLMPGQDCKPYDIPIVHLPAPTTELPLPPYETPFTFNRHLSSRLPRTCK